MKYLREVKLALKTLKDEAVKKEILALFNYLSHGYANEVLFANRDYQLGLIDEHSHMDVLMKCYNQENRLRALLGLEPLPPVDLSII